MVMIKVRVRVRVRVSVRVTMQPATVSWLKLALEFGLGLWMILHV